jgi:hypothetical protein
MIHPTSLPQPDTQIRDTTLASWIQNGFDAYLSLGSYFSDSGSKFNNSSIQNGFTSRLGSVLLFPVYDTLAGQGSNAVYHVIAWVGFHLDSFSIQGSGSLTGYFTTMTVNGIQSQQNPNIPNLGARSIALVG